ncbi:MAG: hypothetical protein R3Y43_08040 [Alphaproteobacteria bacterium]
MTDKEPNIFEYATSELSQDAFLCWLLAWGKDEYKSNKLHKIAKEFLKELTGQDGFNIVDIVRQHKKIDVLVILKKDKENYALIIEDKTNTSEHSKQIQRYVKVLKDEGYKLNDNIIKFTKENIFVAFVKTGYTSEQERRSLEKSAKDLEENNFKIIGHSDFKNFFSNIEDKHPLITDWFREFNKKYENIIEAQKLFNSNNFKESLNKNSDVFLDNLTQKIINETNYKDSYWYLAGQGRTPHICLYDNHRIMKDNFSIHHGIYLMFREKHFNFVVKQHIFKLAENKEQEVVKNNLPAIAYRIGIKGYLKLDEEIHLQKNKLRENIVESCKWSCKATDDKENLIVVQSESDYSDDFVEQIINKKSEVDKIINIIERKIND